jgi:glycosyltransferase involved in cell wall biosynthesis
MERAVQELSGALAAETGMPVQVVTGRRGEPRSVRTEGPVEVHRLRSFDVGVTPVIPGLVTELLRLPRPDLYHVHVAHAGTPEAVALVARLRRVPFIAHVHIDAGPTTWMGVLLDGYQRQVLARVLGQAALVLVPTASYEEVLVEKYRLDRERIRVIPYGSLMERRTDREVGPIPDDRPLRLLTVGRMAAEKNVALLVDSVAALVERDGLDVELMIVGDGPTRDAVDTQVRRLGLGSRVQLAGRLDGADLVGAYDRADLFVMTSLVDSFGIVLIEAMARALPVIAPNIPGVRDVVLDGTCGLLIEHTVESVGAAVRRVVAEPGLYEHLVTGALEYSAEFEWPATVRRYGEYYREVLAAAGAGAPA